MINRRTFLLGSAAVLTVPLVAETTSKAYAGAFKPLGDPYNTIALVIEDLFPPLPGIPTLHKLNTLGYIRAAMEDQWIPQNEKVFLYNGTDWLHEESVGMFARKYYLLAPAERQEVLRAVSLTRWGDNWLYTLFNYLFESMFCDPLYGANTGAEGWKWLSHEPGYPRPKKVLL